jgi:hypothetical protein
MAITTTTIGINTANVGTWTNSDVINQFEKAFEWLGWHGESRSGLCVGLSTFSGGGTVSGNSEAFEDVLPISTSGIGTGASFYVQRTSGPISSIYVNRPGYGYTGGETLTLSAEDIGGSGNGATDIQVKVAVAGTIANGVGYAITFTGIYSASGTDRNGVVSGQGTTITIREGDTLTFTNNQSSSSYNINIIWNGNNTTSAANTNRVFNVSNQNNDNNSGGQTTWTPLPGQAGTYFVRDDGNGFTSETPRIIVEPTNPVDISYVGVGSTTTFYSKKTNDTDPFGVLRHTIQSGKKYGDTYRGILMRNEDIGRLYMFAGSGYFDGSYSTNTGYGGGHGYPYRYTGTRYLDFGQYDIFSERVSLDSGDTVFNYASTYRSSNYILTVGNSTTYQLDLNIFRSSLDPKFAVFSFKAPTKSSSHISGNTYATFIFHNFTTDIWDLDYLFLGGLTEIKPNGDGSTSEPNIRFITYLTGMDQYEGGTFSRYGGSKRTAEFGYATNDFDNASGQGVYAVNMVQTKYYATTYPQSTSDVDEHRTYYRNSNNAIRSKGGANELTGNASISANVNYNAVIKGIPLNAKILPCPYYLPDDFVLINVDYAVPYANIQQGDTVTISGSEVYTVINGSYNNTNANRTRGILFCARTV